MAYSYISSSVILSVCPLVTSVYCGKMADSIEMPFGVVGLVDTKKHVLDMVRISHSKGQLLEGMVWHNLTYLTINFSAILKRIGVTEIGCKSDNEAGCDNLGT